MTYMRRLKFSFTVNSATKALTALLAIIFLYTIYDLTVSIRRQDIVKSLIHITEKANHKEAVGDDPSGVRQQPLSYYMQEAQRRELFKRSSQEDAQQEGAAAPGPQGVKLEEAAKTLSLKGIIEGDIPQAVIEDTKTGKTYFVRQGEKLSEFTVGKILSNKVVLKLGEKSVDLTL